MNTRCVCGSAAASSTRQTRLLPPRFWAARRAEPSGVAGRDSKAALSFGARRRSCLRRETRRKCRVMRHMRQRCLTVPHLGQRCRAFARDDAPPPGVSRLCWIWNSCARDDAALFVLLSHCSELCQHATGRLLTWPLWPTPLGKSGTRTHMVFARLHRTFCSGESGLTYRTLQ